MRELKFDGLSPDGSTLILVGKDGQKWSLSIDERIEAAVRRDRARIGQVEIEQAGVLRPREIQARIRSGATAEDVAAASGLSLEHIRRFEGPVLTERAWVAQQAQATEVRRPGSDIQLGDLVTERLEAEGLDAQDISWDAWRREDGNWVVIATFPIPPNTHVATWTYDSGSRTMTVVDDNARSLSAIDPDAPLRLSATRPSLSTVAPLGGPTHDDQGRSASVTPMSRRDRDTADVAHPGAGPDESADAEAEEQAQAERPFGAADPAEATETEGAASEAEQADEQGPEAGSGDVDAALAVGESESESVDVGNGPTADAEDVELFTTPKPARKPGRKPSVPSFDDILFGPGPGGPST